MFLKSIEINGFKSFANKTTLAINDGITGIVGPNGSGKSNIADAIRWVLGEQSSKNLRGAKMEDVIFNGSQSKGRKAVCEVALTFDNEDKKIHSDYSEIVISRKMYRSGESEYMINRSPVRLRDVLEIIRDTGIGKEGYSIIGQGRVDEILESKPSARRRVFEEAAGIVKFRTRKEEAEKKLERADENLVRIEDILEEINTQIEPMREQAENTRRYRSLFERQRLLDANIFLINLERSENKIAKLEEELSIIDRELSEGADEADTSGEKLESISCGLKEAELESDRLGSLTAELKTELERKEGNQKLIDERLHNLEAEAERLAGKNSGAEAERQRIEAEIGALACEKNAAQTFLQQKNSELFELAAKRDEEDKEEQRRRSEAAAAAQRRLELLDRAADIKSSQSGLAAEIQAYESNLSDIQKRIEKNREEQEKHKGSIDSERDAFRMLEERKKSISVQVNENNDAIQRLYMEEDKKRAENEVAKKAYNDAVSRQKLFLELKKEYDGYSDGVRKLMTDGAKTPELSGRIMGTVADLIRVPGRFETAIETLLGGALQNVVVRDEYDAKQCIEYLRRNHLGRITFLPIRSLRFKRLTEAERRASQHRGFIAVASEAVEYSAEAAPAVEFLLARTVIVEDMDSAIEIMRAFDYSFRAVTLKGDVLRPGGSISGGSTAKKKFGFLSRERQVDEAGLEISQAKETLSATEKLLEDVLGRIEEKKRASERLLQELRTNEKETAAQREKIASGDALFQSAYSAGVVLQSQLALLKNNNGTLFDKKEALESELSAVNGELETVKEQLAQNEPASEEAGLIQEQINAVKIAVAEKAKEVESIDQNMERLRSELEKMTETIELREARLFETMENKTAQAAEKAANEREMERLKKECAEAEQRLREADERKQDLRDSMQRYQKVTSEFQMRYTSLTDRKYKAEGQIEKARLSLESQSDKLWDVYEMTLADAEQLKTDVGYQESVNEVRDIKEKIRELGTINPNAVEDYERLHTRAEDLQIQREDLIKAELDLNRLIEELMGTMKETFQEKFALINEYFQEIFKELFGGGRAELSFDGGDIMECGINIAAEPPGKRLQHISLLSGGERALTAIALLFAMLRINPSPVCLLDEIDAPLDEANVVRFSHYLKHISSTQFLVITHRKPTIVSCDTLYGVAMEEKGVSAIVSVKLK